MSDQTDQRFKSLKVIHVFLVLGASLVYYFLGYVQNPDFLKFPNGGIDSWIFICVPLFALLGSRLLFKQFLRNGNDLSHANKPVKWETYFASYQTACLVRWAVLEGAAFILIFLKPEFILFGVLLILYMAFLRPSQEELKRELSL